ncbi:MAG: hypothetical protein NC079_08980 [Clostridium sp.]|nr:hypothetical protein [Acetatifactor muris]MCM1527746.1 hypothetical protein [Bacteroides sp.]MCM1563724.1 hypothetical protein [Clostridium sp.]
MKRSYGYIFPVGLIAGILMMNLGKDILLENTGLLDEDTLRYMSSAATDGSVLFAFVLRKRMLFVGAMALIATTYLGVAACVFAAGWYGLATGAFLAAGVLRYGVRGILLVSAATLPQYLLYGPAIYALLLWCEKTCRMIYGKKRYRGAGTEAEFRDGSYLAKRPAVFGRIFSLLVIFLVMVAGCALESYVNPAILRAFWRIG